MLQPTHASIGLNLTAICIATLAACGGSDSPGPEETRPQDARNAFVAPTAALDAMTR